MSKTHPKLAQEADGWDASSLTAGSHRRVGWRCSKGHVWLVTVKDRAQYQTGCPFCSGRKTLRGFNDLTTTHPHLAREAHGWDPGTLSKGSHKRVSWACERGHTWEATINSRTNRELGCPICSGRKTLAGFNDLASKNPALALEASGWDPSTVTPGSNRRVSWRCSLGHVWTAAVCDRAISGNGCPYCSGHSVLAGFNDLATRSPELAMQADGWNPSKVGCGSHRKLAWKCERGHTWKASINNRFRNKAGCPICGNRAIADGINDLASTHPELASQAHNWDPSTVTYGSGEVKEWKCSQGHIWRKKVFVRAQGINCPICANKIVLRGFNDLATTMPHLAREAYKWDPTTVTKSSGKRREWICEQGHIWRTQIASRSNGSGCPTCAASGYDPNQPGYLYFLENPSLELLQIGITNDPKSRIAQHERRSWTCLEIKGPIDGHWIRATETAALQCLQRAGALFADKARLEKFDGYSESWLKSSYPVKSLKEILDLVHQMESEELDNH